MPSFDKRSRDPTASSPDDCRLFRPYSWDGILGEEWRLRCLLVWVQSQGSLDSLR